MRSQVSDLVLGKDGWRGRLLTDLAGLNPDSPVLIGLEDGQKVWVPKQELVMQEDGSYFLPLSRQELEQAHVHRSNANDQAGFTLPVLEEKLQVEKHTVETGRMRIHKSVQERQEIVDEPLLRETVTVEHVPVNRVCEGPTPAIRQEGETLIIPVLEEVLVVEKKLMLKEELHVRRRQQIVHEPQSVTLRRETVDVERTETPAPPK